MARRYDIRSKTYEKSAPSASVRAQAGSTASTSGEPARVAAPSNGAVTGEQESATRKKEAQLEESRACANMQEFFKQTLKPQVKNPGERALRVGRRQDPGERALCPLNRRPSNEEA